MAKAEVEKDAAPKPRFKGRFSVYDTEGGGIHIAWIPDGIPESETQHIDLPGPIVSVIKQVGEGKLKNPMEIMKLIGMGGMMP